MSDEWKLTADLARLNLDENEQRLLAREAERMRELFQTMADADVDALEPTTHANRGGNRTRNDTIEHFDDIGALIEASPEAEDDFFLIPNVL